MEVTAFLFSVRTTIVIDERKEIIMQEIIEKDFLNDLEKIKRTIQTNRNKALYVVNSAMIITYYQIGSIINKRKKWGNKYIQRLADDLREYGRGYSREQLKRMARFSSLFNEEEIGAQVVTQIPWGTIVLIMMKAANKDEMLWYFGQTVKNTWSRANVLKQFQNQAYQRHQIEPMTNEPELLNEVVKDTLSFDFISKSDVQTEQDLKNKLIDNIILFLQELGQGFALVGKEYRLAAPNGRNYYLDLLMYHTKIHAYVVVEVKLDIVEPKDFGQLNFYINAVNELEKTTDDNDTVGILLCKNVNNFEVQTTLKGMNNPIGVSKYRLFEELPSYLEKRLKEIE